MQYPKIMQPSHARWEQVRDDDVYVLGNSEDQENQTMFHPVKPIYSRNFAIVDTVLESPAGPWGLPGPDGDAHDLGYNGLSAVSDDLKAELPPECRLAFEEALGQEVQWKRRWGTETKDGSRVHPPIDKGQF